MATLRENGKIAVLAPVYPEGAKIVGHVVVELGPEDPDYELWCPYLDTPESEERAKKILAEYRKTHGVSE
mgnify:CR=1 FL=1